MHSLIKTRLATLVQYLATTSYMNTPINSRPSVQSRCEATDYRDGRICDAVEDTKNIWLRRLRTGCHLNLNVAMFNVRTLSSVVRLTRLTVLFKGLAGTRWDTMEFNKVGINEAYTVLTSTHVLFNRCLADSRGLGVELLVN